MKGAKFEMENYRPYSLLLEVGFGLSHHQSTYRYTLTRYIFTLKICQIMTGIHQGVLYCK